MTDEARTAIRMRRLACTAGAPTSESQGLRHQEDAGGTPRTPRKVKVPPQGAPARDADRYAGPREPGPGPDISDNDDGLNTAFLTRLEAARPGMAGQVRRRMQEHP